ncbi:MAG TPA: rRNA maturation RNase YbeY [Rhizomicrobium sp.]|nr:rRNA maturation RNase YbeY [Rhizomicrobium sp.]
MSGRDIIFLVDDPNWKKARGLEIKLRRAARQAALQGGFKGKGALSVLLGSDAKLRALNRDFRGLDKPTNVLSFPAGPNAENYLGDVALAYGVTAKEAKAAGKSLGDHAAHLVVHGVLHLAGYDHERVRDAEKMESLEVKILDELGIANPYRVNS